MLYLRILLLALFCGSFSGVADSATVDSTTADGAKTTETKTLVWPDGTRYVGGVQDGKRSGKGTIFWQDGTRFVGTFENDQRNGPGTMILPDGTVYNGYFENDTLTDKAETATRSEPTAPVAEISAEDATQLAANMNLGEQAMESKAPSANDQIENTALQSTQAAAAAEANRAKKLPIMTLEMRQQVQDVIDRWAVAWSAQDVDGYLAAYGESFTVPGRQSRRQWEGIRRSRLTRPAEIDVNVIYDTFEVVAENKIQVDFNQVYESNLFSDRTNKRVVLLFDGTHWKIISETSI